MRQPHGQGKTGINTESRNTWRREQEMEGEGGDFLRPKKMVGLERDGTVARM